MTLTLKQFSRCYTQYFNGHILNVNTREDTEWFVSKLEKGVGKKIRATYPLYRLDKKNNNSIHDYVDGKPQIALVVRMTNGQILAAYSDPEFKPQSKIDYRFGMMFAFTNRKVFTLKNQPSNKANKSIPKPITYDQYYIIWGNSEIRIKSGTNELYSNYSTGNCFYEEPGNDHPSVRDLFLSDERDNFLTDYELYQV